MVVDGGFPSRGGERRRGFDKALYLSLLGKKRKKKKGENKREEDRRQEGQVFVEALERRKKKGRGERLAARRPSLADILFQKRRKKRGEGKKEGKGKEKRAANLR